MIQANELRIGNLLQCSLTKALLRVTDISETGFTTYVIDRSKYPLPDGWSAQGIPLNEYILLKCGFVCETKNKGLESEFKVYINGEFVFNTSHKSFWWRNSKIFIQPKYLHQLQNLYFALTGKELEVTL